MRYFDLHCDTLTKMSEEGFDFSAEELHINKGRAKVFEEYIQVFAFFTDDTGSLAGAKQKMKQAMEKFAQIENVTPLFAIEGSGVLEDDIDNLEEIDEQNPCFFSLCWNGENAFACGNMTDPGKGLTRKGKKLVRLLEEKNIFLDVSHLSDAGFTDLAKTAKKPFVATHSNARKICPHLRNCTDEQLLEIFSRKGLCGLNFYPPFVGNKPEDILKHIEHMLSLGGEDRIAVGGDWDGMIPFEGTEGITSVPFYYEITERAFGKTIANKIFFENAYAFFERNYLLN